MKEKTRIISGNETIIEFDRIMDIKVNDGVWIDGVYCVVDSIITKEEGTAAEKTVHIQGVM